MKNIVKEIRRILVDLGLIGLAGYFARTLYKAKKFQISCDINLNAIDTVSIFNIKKVAFREQKMRDLKIGAFFGILEYDISELEFLEKQYEITVDISQGYIELTIPEDISVFVSSNNLLKIIDNRVESQLTDKLLVINANIDMGILKIKNRQD